MTRARFVTVLSPSWSGLSRLTFATAVFISVIAFGVPSSISLWTQEHCSRMLAISTMNGLMPAFSATARNVASCIRGEQEQTTIAVRP